MSATLPGQVSAEKMRALKAQTVPTEAFKKFEKKRKQALEDIEQNRKETAAQLRHVGEVLRNNADSKDESGKRPPKTGSAKDEKTKRLDHIVYDCAPEVSPLKLSCYTDEDAMGKLKKLAMISYPNQMGRQVLSRYAAYTCVRWLRRLTE